MMHRATCRARWLRAAASVAAVFALAACSPPPADMTGGAAPAPQTENLDSAVSERGLYRVQVAPRDGPAPLARFHEWTITLTDSDGTPVPSARIAVDGGMPGHGHGLPSQPQVTTHLGEGVYRIEGMLFNMAGAWELVFTIDAPPGRDRVRIEFDLSV